MWWMRVAQRGLRKLCTLKTIQTAALLMLDLVKRWWGAREQRNLVSGSVCESVYSWEARMAWARRQTLSCLHTHPPLLLGQPSSCSPALHAGTSLGNNQGLQSKWAPRAPQVWGCLYTPLRCLTSPSFYQRCRGPGKDLKFTARPPIELTGRLFAQFSPPFRPEWGGRGAVTQ